MKKLLALLMPTAVAVGALTATGCSSSEEAHVYRAEQATPVAYETRETRVVERPVTYETRTVHQPMTTYDGRTYGAVESDPYHDYYADPRWDDDGDGWDDVEIHHGNMEVEVLLEEKYDE